MNFKEIKELIGIIQDSNLAEFNYKKDDLELKIRTDKFSKNVTVSTPLPVVAPVVPSAPAHVTEKSDGESDDSVSTGSNVVEVKSPIVGTFFRSSGPDKDAFVKVGDIIEEGSVVCIVEAMKLFNEIESEVSGKIVKVLVDDSTPVEYDQPLFLVEA